MTDHDCGSKDLLIGQLVQQVKTLTDEVHTLRVQVSAMSEKMSAGHGYALGVKRGVAVGIAIASASAGAGLVQVVEKLFG